MDKILSLAKWICNQLTRVQLVNLRDLLTEILDGKHPEIEIRDAFKEDHPHYRKYSVDPLEALRESPEPQPDIPVKGWRQLLKEFRKMNGKDPKPIKRRAGSPVPEGPCRCCGAPSEWLYYNDGKKRSQIRCKLCGEMPSAAPKRVQAKIDFWCPHCHRPLYKWKTITDCTIHKCGNDNCPATVKALAELNDRERERLRMDPGMASQFKLHYQWRDYHFELDDIRTAKPETAPVQINRIQSSMQTLALVLVYCISCGLSARKTAWIMENVHGVKLSHQTVINWLQSAAVLAFRFQEKYGGGIEDLNLAADETYAKVGGFWSYVWFVIGEKTKAIAAWNISEGRGMEPALATLNEAIKNLNIADQTVVNLIADGNPSYDAAKHAYNQLAGEDGIKVKRYKVIGLENKDPESELYRRFKQLIERLNRTYKASIHNLSGLKVPKGIIAITALFVVHYNFLRPHGSLGYRTPLRCKELDGIQNLQGKWLKILQLAS